ncbi:hypothetical protein SDC9_164417 [bioreactor metagenome]|uniref:Uncharacterized protein n=1 Tax=bioreactor metagenome TaxID=1076179 RepID=A0A645FRL3_9ZZZZ
MQGHHIHPEQLAGIDHVLRVGPQCSARTLPGIATIEQQRARAAGLHLLDQRRQVGEAADLAVGPGGLDKIQIGKGVRLCRSGLDTEMLEEAVAHDVRCLTEHAADAEVDVGLAEVDR